MKIKQPPCNSVSIIAAIVSKYIPGAADRQNKFRDLRDPPSCCRCSWTHYTRFDGLISHARYIDLILDSIEATWAAYQRERERGRGRVKKKKKPIEGRRCSSSTFDLDYRLSVADQAQPPNADFRPIISNNEYPSFCCKPEKLIDAIVFFIAIGYGLLLDGVSTVSLTLELLKIEA